ncbi:MAG: hypothetical protein Q4F72_10275 [Desulfovibrionaceae bacterium]|nr:hypothetical protein [Desulfovibrionaceae bacterium]
MSHQRPHTQRPRARLIVPGLMPALMIMALDTFLTAMSVICCTLIFLSTACETKNSF